MIPTPIAAIVVASPTRRSAALNAYVSTEKLGQRAGERFVAQSGINGCIPEYAERQMRDNRKRWFKDGTRRMSNERGKSWSEGEYVQAYHVIQSFARDGVGGLDPTHPQAREEAHELGVQLARRLAGRGRLATVTTQIDGRTGCIHNHLVIDSVDKSTGRSFDSSCVKHSELVACNDRVLADAGYQQVNAPGKGRDKLERSELRGLAKYRSWEADKSGPEPFSVAVLKQRIRDALTDQTFTDWDQFEDVALAHGVLVEQRGQSGRGVTHTMLRDRDEHGDDWLPVSRSDRRRASKLGLDFSMGAIERAVERNLDLVARRVAAPVRGRSALDAVLAAHPGITNLMLDESLAEERKGLHKPADAGHVVSADPHRPTPLDVHAAAHGSAEPLESTDTTNLECLRGVEPAHEANHGSPQLSEAPRVVEEAESPDEPAYRSRLRSVRTTTARGQHLVDDLAQLDEDSVQVLGAGGRLDEELLRRIGIGPKLLAPHGAWLHPDLLAELERRQEKAMVAKTRYETGRIEEAKDLREQIRAGDYSADLPEGSSGETAGSGQVALYERHPELRPDVDADLSKDVGRERE